MKDLLPSIVIGFLSGLAGAAVVIAIDSDDTSPASEAATIQAPSTTAETAQPAVRESVEEPAAAVTVAADEADENESSSPDTATALSPEERRSEARRNRNERMADQLRQVGWSDAEIDSLDDLRNAAALEMEQMIYDQMREASEDDKRTYRGFFGQDTFRNSLGDEKYEQYREASGQPTAVTVRNLLRGSAADNAGIQQGDKIRRYGDTRVFDEADLFNALIDGEPGEPVTVEIERDGAVFHVTVPRGPMGTAGLSRRWR